MNVAAEIRVFFVAGRPLPQLVLLVRGWRTRLTRLVLGAGGESFGHTAVE